ncbi:hypothetical protein DOU02_06735 [Clavibacter michiganensis subsp. michiganensis]|uniref:hypothetical protein n=1 Tax=Clavibacter michiganensis TaxID=28447 RepID=UPI0013030ED8|nr:hypothetical protein [Clavibacter michiganensis]KAF0258774.1 hypothetical protein DOU02_06735 [Clavibacter michiganensis subsp. michiganensis]
MIAVVAGLEIEVEDDSINFDEAQSPHVEWTATAKVPVTQADMDLLDPRRGVRALVTLGDSTLDLLLTERSIDRPSNTMKLTARSDEQVLMNNGTGTTTLTFPPGSEAHRSIQRIIREALPDAVFQDSGVRGFGWTAPDEDYVVAPGDNAQQAAWEIADRAGDRWVYQDGHVWRIRERPELAETPAAALTIGEDGVIVSSSTALTLDDFYNSVLVVHTWTTEDLDGEGKTVRNERRAEGWASIMSGPFEVTGPAGRKTLRVERNYAGTRETAEAAARSLLNRTSSRGRSMSLAAVPTEKDLALRPGDTISIQLPTGPAELHLISGITFSRPDSLMQITTRVPSDAPITTGA